MSIEDRLIRKTARLAELAVELKESISYERCDYHLDTIDNARYILVNISSGKILVCGTPSRIKSYMNLRAIDTEKIYAAPGLDNNFLTN